MNVDKQVSKIDISKQVKGMSLGRVIDNMVGKQKDYTVPRRENYTTKKNYRLGELADD